MICIIGICIKCPAVINNNNYALFERKNLEIALIALYASVDIKPFFEKGGNKLKLSFCIEFNETIIHV